MSFSLIRNERPLYNVKAVNNLIIPLKSGLGRQGRNRPRRGAIMFNKGDNSFYGYNGTSWNSLSAPGAETETVENVVFDGNSESNPTLTFVRVGNTVYVTFSTELISEGGSMDTEEEVAVIPENFRPTGLSSASYIDSNGNTNSVEFYSDGFIAVSNSGEGGYSMPVQTVVYNIISPED